MKTDFTDFKKNIAYCYNHLIALKQCITFRRKIEPLFLFAVDESCVFSNAIAQCAIPYLGPHISVVHVSLSSLLRNARLSLVNEYKAMTLTILLPRTRPIRRVNDLSRDPTRPDHCKENRPIHANEKSIPN